MALLIPARTVATPFALAAGATAVLIIVAAWEWMSSLRRVPASAHQ